MDECKPLVGDDNSYHALSEEAVLVLLVALPFVFPVLCGRGLHSFPIQLNLSSSVRRITRLSS